MHTFRFIYTSPSGKTEVFLVKRYYARMALKYLKGGAEPEEIKEVIIKPAETNVGEPDGLGVFR